MILNIPCRGYGPSASIAFVVTRGYSIGAAAAVDTVPDVTWHVQFQRGQATAQDGGTTWNVQHQRGQVTGGG